MNKLFLLFVPILILFSCSKDEPKPNPDPEPEPTVLQRKFKLRADKHVVNIYEYSFVELDLIDVEAEFKGKGEVVIHGFDSISWKIPNIFDEPGRGNGYMVANGFTFIKPGKYLIYAFGHADGKVTFKDSVTVNVINKRDFLGVNWKNVKDSLFVSYDENVNNIRFNLESKYNDGKAYAILRANPSYTKFKGFEEGARKEFIKIINNLYGESKYSYNGDDYSNSDLLDEFDSMFKKGLGKNNYPIKIWQTEKNNIVLLANIDREFRDYYYYYILAEPRN